MYSVSWQEIVDSRLTGYKLYYSTAPFSSGSNIKTVTLGTDTSYSFSPGSSGITKGSTVYLAVAAIGTGLESPLSDTTTVTVQ